MLAAVLAAAISVPHHGAYLDQAHYKGVDSYGT